MGCRMIEEKGWLVAVAFRVSRDPIQGVQSASMYDITPPGVNLTSASQARGLTGRVECER